MDRVELYFSHKPSRYGGGWRWRYVAAGNNMRMANGGQGFNSYSDVLASMCRVVSLSLRSEDWLQLGDTDSWIVRRLGYDGADEAGSIIVVKQS